MGSQPVIRESFGGGITWSIATQGGGRLNLGVSSSNHVGPILCPNPHNQDTESHY